MALKLRRAEERFIPQSTRAASFKRLLGSGMGNDRSNAPAGEARVATERSAAHDLNPSIKLVLLPAYRGCRGVNSPVIAVRFGRRENLDMLTLGLEPLSNCAGRMLFGGRKVVVNAARLLDVWIVSHLLPSGEESLKKIFAAIGVAVRIRRMNRENLTVELGSFRKERTHRRGNRQVDAAGEVLKRIAKTRSRFL